MRRIQRPHVEGIRGIIKDQWVKETLADLVADEEDSEARVVFVGSGSSANRKVGRVAFRSMRRIPRPANGRDTALEMRGYSLRVSRAWFGECRDPLRAGRLRSIGKSGAIEGLGDVLFQ